MPIRSLVATLILLACGAASAQGALPLPVLHTVDGRQVEILSGGIPGRLGKVIVDSDHRIQEANPEMVVRAIEDVVSAGRQREALQH